jgi:hypothetical protein
MDHTVRPRMRRGDIELFADSGAMFEEKCMSACLVGETGFQLGLFESFAHILY